MARAATGSPQPARRQILYQKTPRLCAAFLDHLMAEEKPRRLTMPASDCLRGQIIFLDEKFHNRSTVPAAFTYNSCLSSRANFRDALSVSKLRHAALMPHKTFVAHRILQSNNRTIEQHFAVKEQVEGNQPLSTSTSSLHLSTNQLNFANTGSSMFRFAARKLIPTKVTVRLSPLNWSA